MAFFDLTGKVAFITGTSRGLGQYFARALAQAGADIAMSSRDASKLAPFRKEIEALGRRTCASTSTSAITPVFKPPWLQWRSRWVTSTSS